MRYLHYRTFVCKCPYRKTVQKEPRNFYLNEKLNSGFGPNARVNSI